MTSNHLSPNIRPYNGEQPKIAQSVYLDSTAVVIGKVEIGEDCSIWPHAVIRGDMHSIIVGKKTSLQDHCVIHITHDSKYNPGGWSTTVGDEVTVGHRATLHGCTVGNRVLIGIGAIVMDGAVIEDEVMVGAGTLVPPGKTLESGHVYVGNPARKVRPLREEEKKALAYSATRYVRLKNTYLSERAPDET